MKTMNGANLSPDIVGNIAVNIFSYNVLMTSNVFRPTTQSDMGIDGSIEFFEGEYTTKNEKGIICWVQVKGSYSEDLINEPTNIRSSIYKKSIEYWNSLNQPVIIVKVTFNRLNNYSIKFMTSQQLGALIKGKEIKYPWAKATVFEINQVLHYCNTYKIPEQQYAQFRNYSKTIEDWSSVFELLKPLIVSLKINDSIFAFPPYHHQEYLRQKLTKVKVMVLWEIQNYVDYKSNVGPVPDDASMKSIIKSVSFFFCVIEENPINKIREDILTIREFVYYDMNLKQFIEASNDTISPILDVFVDNFGVDEEDIRDIKDYIKLFMGDGIEVELTDENS